MEKYDNNNYNNNIHPGSPPTNTVFGRAPQVWLQSLIDGQNFIICYEDVKYENIIVSNREQW